LSIDTEGTELEVWDSIGGIRPRVVIIEHLTGAQASQRDVIEHRFLRDGYELRQVTRCNLIFEHKGIFPSGSRKAES
jgi:hypothetical protein